MKPAFHFIWSPLLFAALGLLIAWKIADVAPREVYFTNQTAHLSRLTNPAPVFTALIMMPAAGLVLGWLLAYLATPTKPTASRLVPAENPVAAQRAETD